MWVKECNTWLLIITLANVDRFTKFIHCQISEQTLCELLQGLPPHLNCVATLSCSHSSFTLGQIISSKVDQLQIIGVQLKRWQFAVRASKQDYQYYEQPAQQQPEPCRKGTCNRMMQKLTHHQSRLWKYTHCTFPDACHVELLSAAEQWIITWRFHFLSACIP